MQGMRRIHVFISLAIWTGILLLGTVSASAQEPEALFENANQLYRAEKYAEAVEAYLKILESGWENAAVYYNLGNACYRLGQIGRAVLYYEKALKLAPNDPDIRYNLELANLNVVDRIEMPPRFFLFEWWDVLVNYFSVRQLSRLLISFFVLGIISWILFLFVKNALLQRLSRISAISFLVLTISAAGLLYLRAERQLDHRFAIVLEPTVTVYSAPDENSTDVFVLHEGVKVKVDDSRPDWVKISLPDGKTGWMPAQFLQTI
ncbi:MAG: tetratricopeptide repeat protein [Calditrichia bacterium]